MERLIKMTIMRILIWRRRMIEQIQTIPVEVSRAYGVHEKLAGVKVN